MGIFRFLALIFFIIAYEWSMAQNVTVFVKDTDGLPLVGTTIELKNVEKKDAVFNVTDRNGIARFENISDGLYDITVRFIGFETIEKTINVREGHRFLEYTLKESAISLGAVTISGRRPLITQEGDKMIIDPEPMAAISTNTLEILESTPGLFVDQDGGIYLTSATPATVYINGREQKMSNQDIGTILRSLPPGSVQRIEVLRTPSAKYDAASTGGIINIVLKKGVRIGRFGSVNAGMNQGISGNRFAGFSLNNSGENSTSYINANYSFNGRTEELNIARSMRTDTSMYQAPVTEHGSHQGFVGYGINYDVSENFNISYDGRINISKRASNTENHNTIKTAEEVILMESFNELSSTSDFVNLQQDIGLRVSLDTNGSNLLTRFSYNYNNNNGLQDYKYDYRKPFDTIMSGDGDNLQKRHFYVLQSDLSYRLPWKLNLEAGFKISVQDYSSRSDYYIHKPKGTVLDNRRTNAFNYDERLSAAYLQASRDIFAGFHVKAGLRMEHTYMKGQQTVPSDTSFVIDRIDWFPYVFLSRKIIDIMGIELDGYLIYRKTISRPGYQSLNPYIRFIDEFLYEMGNPALQPQFTENYEANISFNHMPLFAIGQNYTRDVFSNVVYQDEVNENIAVQTYDNVGTNKETYFRGIVGIPPGGTYFFALGAQYNLNAYDGFYENEPLKYERGSWRFFTYHALNIGENTRLTLTGFMMQNGQYNFYNLNTFGLLNIGLNQTFLNKRLTITLSARDILRTMGTEFELSQGSIETTGSRYTDNRRFGINIRYNFGIRDKAEDTEMFDFDGFDE